MKNNIWLVDPLWSNKYFADRNEAPPKFEAGFVEELLAKRQPVLEISDSEATVYISGPMTEDGPDAYDLWLGYGGVSYTEVFDALYEADKTLSGGKEIKLRVNTPGGDVSGVEMLYEAVKDIASRRPVNTYNMGMIASAGTWSTAASTNITAVGRTVMSGSVGVAITITDYSEAEKKEGVNVYHLVNPESADKRPDIVTEEGRNVHIKVLQSMYAVFIDQYLEGRGSVTSKAQVEALKGALVTADEALARGLIDKIEGTGLNAINQPAAILAGSHERDTDMGFLEYLKENPAAAAQVEKIKAEARKDGAEREREDIKGRTARMEKFTKSASYPMQIREAAISAISGDRSVQSVEDFAALYEMSHEKKESDKVVEDLVADVPMEDGSKIKVNKEDEAINAEADLINGMLG